MAKLIHYTNSERRSPEACCRVKGYFSKHFTTLTKEWFILTMWFKSLDFEMSI